MMDIAHDDYDATDALFNRGAMLRRLRQLEQEDEAARELEKSNSDLDNMKNNNNAPKDTYVYGDYLATQGYYDDYKHVNYRFIEFDSNLIIEQDRNLGKGGFIWDAGYILADHVIQCANLFWDTTSKTNRSIVELGSGTGVCGLLIAKAFSNVQMTLTDLPLLMPLLQKNIDNNKMADAVSASVVEWGGDDVGDYDIILGADVVASIYTSSGLAKTIYQLAHEKTIVIMAVNDRLMGTVRQFENDLSELFSDITYMKPCSRNKNPNVSILIARGKRQYQ